MPANDDERNVSRDDEVIEIEGLDEEGAQALIDQFGDDPEKLAVAAAIIKRAAEKRPV